MGAENLNILEGQELPPRISLVEQDAKGKSSSRPFHSISDTTIHTPEAMTARERSDEFERAYHAIVGNEELEKLVVKGMKSVRAGNASTYSQLMNTLSEICISLSDTEIDNIVRRFKEEIRKKAIKYGTEFNLSGIEIRDLQAGMWGNTDEAGGLNPNGIKSVARFVRVRKKLHETDPKTFPAFYFENYLDATHKIDLIEVIEGGNGAIVNLIQIKSHEYEDWQIKEYTQAHRDWVNGFVIDLEAYENTFSHEPIDASGMKEFMTNVDSIQEVFLDMLTGGEIISKQFLFEKLGLGNRPKVEQVWILNEYLPKVIEAVDGLRLDGTIGDAEYLLLMPLFDDISKQLEQVKKQNKDMVGISEVHSICAVNERVVSDTIIFAGEGNKRKSMKVER